MPRDSRSKIEDRAAEGQRRMFPRKYQPLLEEIDLQNLWAVWQVAVEVWNRDSSWFAAVALHEA